MTKNITCIKGPQEVCPETLALVEDLTIIEDPRRRQALRHLLIGILIMALCSIACGADGWDDIADTANLLFEWFKKKVPCGERVPSADTFRRVFQALKPSGLNAALQCWLCFDGKALRGAKQVHADTPSILSDSRAQTCGTIGQLH